MSEKRDDGGPAFPEAGLSGLPNGEFLYGRAGMSMRDYFAAEAIGALLIAGTASTDAQAMAAQTAIKNGVSILDGLAAKSYEIADAMLAQRGKP
jgi:hypothetical protein